ncbi:MAG: diversity-generating retroelement protein Avd [Alkalinema sp. RU_4_3]|nr:diversity-generating retroelement protein Avd [Alkalinema sp. RU_4_3]
MSTKSQELPIIQKTYDLIKWYVPHLNKLPRNHKFVLGDRIAAGLYDVMESLIQARYSRDKLIHLNEINTKLEILRYQTRLLHDFNLLDIRRFEFVSTGFNEIGKELGGWIRQQKPSGSGV